MIYELLSVALELRLVPQRTDLFIENVHLLCFSFRCLQDALSPSRGLETATSRMASDVYAAL